MKHFRYYDNNDNLSCSYQPTLPPQNNSCGLPRVTAVGDAITEEVQSGSSLLRDDTSNNSSPSYSPLSVVEESEGDTSFKEDQPPCFDIGELQDILE